MTRLLVVAGHDPTSGAGVDADLEAARRAGVEATCVVTAWTDQDGERVRALGARPVEEWEREARAAFRSPVQGLKSGLLPGAEHVRALARLIDEHARDLPVVVDPVLAASGGEPFLDAAGVGALLAELVPRGVILTPNLLEAARLTGIDFERLRDSRTARLDAARALLAAGCRAALVKGGHGAGDTVEDLVLERERPPVWLVRPRVHGARVHGSGCRYAALVASELARGAELVAAAEAAGAWLGELFRSRRSV